MIFNRKIRGSRFRIFRSIVFTISVVTCICVAAAYAAEHQVAASGEGPGGGQIVGKTAPGWSVRGWVNGENVELARYRGKVVLLRYLTDSPSGVGALKELQETFGARGFAVIGMFVPTPFPEETDLTRVAEIAAANGLSFPIGLDSRWETLTRYWLDAADADVTSSAFLIDRRGVVRYIQKDGHYDRRSANGNFRGEYSRLAKAIDELLKANEQSDSGAK